MSATERTQVYANYLAQEGFQPQIDSDGDISFKYQGGSYYIIIENNDSEFFRITYPSFWSIDSDEELVRSLIAMEEANRLCKVTKLTLRTDRKSVSASVELFFGDVNHFKPVFQRCLRTIQHAVKIFADKM